ncbi:nuclear transport factor 2 family protein [Embleya sp. NPDC005575]|uniref:nuclear transport factor 2 family protein n=1 Tax=Embleya sp. NPDC005575 TaxID=3156892 RepID=UPI0033BD3008
MSDPARTRRAAEAYVAALNCGDPEAIAARVSEDFYNEHTSTLGRSLRGRATYRERLPGFLAEFEGLRYAVEDLIVDGDRAALAYTMTFRLRDSAAGEPVRIRGVFRLRMVGDLVAHRVDYWDGAEFERQTAGGRTGAGVAAAAGEADCGIDAGVDKNR